jgi:hypothetical protein
MILAATSAASAVSLAPSAREIAKATMGLPSSVAEVRYSAMPTLTVPN